MQIEHVAVYTKDLEALKSFYARYFGTRVGKKYVMPVNSLNPNF
jgi:lactoylglutathione lyase